MNILVGFNSLYCFVVWSLYFTIGHTTHKLWKKAWKISQNSEIKTVSNALKTAYYLSLPETHHRCVNAVQVYPHSGGVEVPSLHLQRHPARLQQGRGAEAGHLRVRHVLEGRVQLPLVGVLQLHSDGHVGGSRLTWRLYHKLGISPTTKSKDNLTLTL